MKDAQFGEIISQYERLVYTICYQFTQNHHTAEDLAQDTFVSAYIHKDSCPMDNVKPWLAKIATNKAKDFLKSAYNRRVQAPGEDGLPENKPVLFLQDQQPEDIAISRDTTAAIESEIRALKEPYKMVSVLFFIEEKSVEEISHILDRPPKTIHTQLYRAKNMLQKTIKEVSHGIIQR